MFVTVSRDTVGESLGHVTGHVTCDKDVQM